MSGEAAVKVTVELCGRLADGIGSGASISLPNGGCSAQALLAEAARQHPALADAIGAGRVKVCANERLLGPGDHVPLAAKIALFPPVSGG